MGVMFGFLGMIGGMLCACGDMFLDIKGKDNVKLGRHGIIDSTWDRMSLWRFRVSILLAMVGIPLACLGLTAMAGQLYRQNETFGFLFWLCTLAGGTGAFFIHTFVCLLPVIHKTIKPEQGPELAEKVINAAYETVRFPFFFLYVLLVIVPSFMVTAALCLGYLQLSPWFHLLTPVTLILIGAILQKVKYDWFCDLPFVIMPSMGLSMIGLMAALNQL